MKIVDYRTADNIDVVFDDGTRVNDVTYFNYTRGDIRNPNAPALFGVGYMGQGKYGAKTDKAAYSHWSHMIERCYSEKYHALCPTYNSACVSDEWKCFQNFASWYYKNIYFIDDERMCLDKDILFKRNKKYSAETCIFVPNSINALFIKRDNDRGKYPVGVHEQDGVLVAAVMEHCKTVYLGRFKTVDEAFLAYKHEKERFIKEVADLMADKIPRKLYDALYRYEVEIDD